MILQLPLLFIVFQLLLPYHHFSFDSIIIVVSFEFLLSRSGKILRKTMANIANGNDWTVSGTIEDPKVFDSLAPIIKDLVLGGITK
mmetsp:Transcript_3113/g.4537  ORF Transcript_3113/g.4537 Transcript_3113/m.4537 type:complete len:86 (+) Transcript_3113:2166-2423(+)